MCDDPTMLKIYHNPRCSKSRAALALVEAYGQRKGIQVEIIEYLKYPPTLAQLKQMQSALGSARPLAACRT